MLFVDTNIFMYAVGSEHPHKIPSLRFFEGVAEGREKIAISTEILQEILYRFWAIKEIGMGLKLFDYAQGLSETVFPITHEAVRRARTLMSRISGLSPRDALHVATMQEMNLPTIVSYDHDFDLVKEIKRIEPVS